MNRTEATALYRKMLAVWPAAKESHDEPTVEVWVNYLSGIEYDIASVALNNAVKACRFFPSIAEVNAQVVTAYQHARTSSVPAPELESPPADIPRLMETLRPVLEERSRVVTAALLDKAGVPGWRERLARARRSDVAFDAEWAIVRKEFAEAGGVGLVAPAYQPEGARRVRRGEVG